MSNNTSSGLTQQLTHKYDPFVGLWRIIRNKHNNDRYLAIKTYEWVIMRDDSCTSTPKVSAMPFVYGSINWNLSQPALTGALFWSKVKFHAMHVSSAWIPKDLRFLIIGYARNIEYALREGIQHHMSLKYDVNLQSEKPHGTYDDFCTFALGAVSSHKYPYAP